MRRIGMHIAIDHRVGPARRQGSAPPILKYQNSVIAETP